jgi:predicted transcriptional regulator
MQMQLSPDQSQRLAELAGAAGYDGVAVFAADELAMLVDGLRPSMMVSAGEDELRASADMCRRGVAALEAGQGLDAREALHVIARKHGLEVQ